MLPTHGAVTSVFHLANSIRHTTQPGVAAWVDAARSRSSFLAAAIDHRPAAEVLMDVGLVCTHPAIELNARLKPLSRQADRHTLVAIAALLLEVAPPPWLGTAVVDGQIRYEFVPSEDLQGLSWLRPELDHLLVSASHLIQSRSDAVALGLGRAAELVVFAALDHLGTSPLLVSEISDHFGYDIETVRGPVRRWEVKGCTTRTRESFHLSRNEFDQCGRHRSEWRVVQVEFDSSALTAPAITGSHVVRIRELSSAALLSIPPPETAQFLWETSARFSPPIDDWTESALAVPDGFQAQSLVILGNEARNRRELAGRAQRQS